MHLTYWYKLKSSIIPFSDFLISVLIISVKSCETSIIFLLSFFSFDDVNMGVNEDRTVFHFSPAKSDRSLS